MAGGHGVVVKKGLLRDTETYMKMGSAGFGLGVKDFRAVFVFFDKAKLQAFVEKGWDFSAQADAAAKSDDKGAAAALAGTALPGVDVYQITKNGFALQATLQGTKYWKDSDPTRVWASRPNPYCAPFFRLFRCRIEYIMMPPMMGNGIR